MKNKKVKKNNKDNSLFVLMFDGDDDKTYDIYGSIEDARQAIEQICNVNGYNDSSYFSLYELGKEHKIELNSHE